MAHLEMNLTPFVCVLAYIDPGTGSLILQLLLGGIASAWILLKLFGRRILAFFGKKPKVESTDN